MRDEEQLRLRGRELKKKKKRPAVESGTCAEAGEGRTDGREVLKEARRACVLTGGQAEEGRETAPTYGRGYTLGLPVTCEPRVKIWIKC